MAGFYKTIATVCLNLKLNGFTDGIVFDRKLFFNLANGQA